MQKDPEARVLSELAERLRYTFAHPRLLQRAMTHSSYAYESQRNESQEPDKSQDRGNEQMEFLGDAVLGMAVAAWLYRHHGGEDEGRLTRLRAAVVSRRNLCRVGKRLELGSYLRLGRGEERSGGRQKSALLSDAVEALIAALYLDGGWDAARLFVEREILDSDEGGPGSRELREIEDCKSALQEWLQGHGAGRAIYTLVRTEGAEHAKRFTVELHIVRPDDTRVSTATGEVNAQATASSKKQAEQDCARIALDKLRGKSRRSSAKSKGPRS